MTSTGAHLAVDIGPETTVAAISRNGIRSPIVFADSLTLPTPAVGDSPGIDLVKALESLRGDEADAVIAVLAEHLRTVAGYCGPCDAVTFTVPPAWGPRIEARVSRAAQDAGLPAPRVLSRAAAIAEHVFPDAPEGATVLVCLLGQHSSSATVVQHQIRAWIRVATQPIPHATGDRIDHALAENAAPHTTVTETLAAQLADARTRLASGRPAAIILAGRPAPVTLNPAELQTAVLSARHAALAAILDTLDAADVDPHQLHGAVVHGELADTVLPPDQLREHIGVEPAADLDGRLATVYGALHSGATTTSTASVDRRMLRTAWGAYGAQLIAPIVAALAGALLQWQIFDIVAFALGPEIRRLPGDYQTLAVVFDTAAFAAAGWCLTAACLAVARNLAIAVLAAADKDHGRQQGRQAGRIYAFAAVVGLALASLQGLLAQAIIGGPPANSPPYLAAALAGAIIPAVIAIIIGLAGSWLTGRPPWIDRIHHPIIAVILAVAGILACNARDSGMPIGGVPKVVTGILGVTGAGLLGVGIAITLVAHPAARLVLGALMGIACMIIVGFSNLHSAIVIYLIVVALWWLRRGSRILTDNLPPRWWRRLTIVEDPVEGSH